jgi:hypothetical protein
MVLLHILTESFTLIRLIGLKTGCFDVNILYNFISDFRTGHSFNDIILAVNPNRNENS